MSLCCPVSRVCLFFFVCHTRPFWFHARASQAHEEKLAIEMQGREEVLYISGEDQNRAGLQ